MMMFDSNEPNSEKSYYYFILIAWLSFCLCVFLSECESVYVCVLTIWIESRQLNEKQAKNTVLKSLMSY